MTYSKRLWLNKESSPSTGSVAAYRGKMMFGDGLERKTAFLEIADCHNKVRLHVSPMDTMEEFMVKMEKLRDFIDDFILFLDEEQVEMSKR
jgi:hypothetical protein